MADKRIFTIQINGVSESVEAITSLNKQLDDLEQRLKNISSQGVSLNVSSGGDSGGKTSSELKEVDKLQKQILATKEKIAQADQDEYQELLKQKNELKEAQNVAKTLAANSRLNDGGYSDTIRGMKQELSDLKTVMNSMNPNDDGFGDMVKRANELNNKLKEIEQSYGQFNRNVGNYANGVAEGLAQAGNSAKGITIEVGGVAREFDNARQASKTLGGELKAMALNGQQGTQEFKDLQQALLAFNSAIKDATVSSEAMDNALDTMSDLAAIGSMGQGFSALFGLDSSAIDESIQKLLALQNVLQSLEALNQHILTGEGIGGWIAKGNAAIDKFVNKLFGLQAASKTTSKSVEGMAVAETKMAAASKGASKATLMLATSIKALMKATVVLAVITAIIEALDWLIDKIGDADKEFDEEQEKLQGQREAYAQATASMAQAQAAVENFNGTKEQEKRLVDELNQKYGDTLGTYKSLDKWKAILSTKTKAYIELMVKQAEMQALLNQYTQDYIELEKLRAKAAEGWSFWRALSASNVDADDIAKATKKLAEDMKAINNKAADIVKHEQKNGLGIYANQYTTSTTNGIKKSGNEIRSTVKKVEEDIIKMQIELMQEGLQKTLAQMRYEREKRIQEAKKSGRKIAEQISLINRLYEKKEFEATQAYYKKQLDALKKFESDRENIIQSNDQRKIENSTTAAENKMNDEWKPISELDYLNFAKTYANAKTSFKKSLDPDKEKEIYKLFLDSISNTKELNLEMQNTEAELKKLQSEFIKNGKLTDEQKAKYDELGKTLKELYSEYNGYAEQLLVSLNVKSLNETFQDRYNARIEYYNDVIKKTEDYYNKLKEIQTEALSGQIQTEKQTENNRHFEVAGDYQNNYLGDLLKAYKNLENSGKLLNLNDDQKEKYFESWKEAWDKWLEDLKDKLKQGKIAEKEFLDDTNNELVKSYQDGTITFVQLMEQLEKEDDTHQNAITTIDKNEYEKRKQLAIQTNQDIQSANATYFGNLQNELDSFISEVKRRIGTEPVMNNFQIVNVAKTKQDLKELVNAVNDTMTKINDLRAQATITFDQKLLSPEQYAEIMEQLDSLTSEILDAGTEVKQKLKDLPADFVASLNTYVQAVGQTISGILSAFQDLQENNFEHQQNMLDKEANMLDKKLSKIDEIYQKHKDNVSSIEDELASARGDRREHLIDQLNNETFAQRQAWMEEKKIQKEKEANEKKQEALAKKKRKEQKKWQLAQAIISGALAITNGFATKPFVPLGIAMGALASTLTAVQIATIASQKTYAKGGVLDSRSVATGPRHSQGGIKLQPYGINAEIEGGEFVTNRKSTSTNLPLLEFINSKKRRVNLNDLVTFYNEGQPVRKSMANIQSRFANGGELPTLNDNLDSTQDRIIANMQELSNRPIYVAVTDIENKMEDVRQVRALAGIH